MGFWMLLGLGFYAACVVVVISWAVNAPVREDYE